MPDREKVMTWLEICGKNRDCSGNCPYGDGTGQCKGRLCREELMADALVLLQDQDQEAVKPTWTCGKPFCGVCGLWIPGGKFCSACGRRIAWEGR